MQLRQELAALGHNTYSIETQVRRGDLVRIRRGAYRDPVELDPEEAHRELLLATLAQTRVPAVASYFSAAVIHDLPVDRRRLAQVHLTRIGASRSESRGPVVRHTQPTVMATEVGGIPVTTEAATAIDLARNLPFRDGVAVMDAALAHGVDRDALLAMTLAGRGRHGNHRARSVVEFADARSESAGESHSRARIAEAGMPVPNLQFVLSDNQSEMRTDFVWPDRRVVGEFDGKIKYGRVLTPGMNVDDALVAERRREIRLERLGWIVIRFCWDDLWDLARVRSIVLEGFDRARRLG